MLTFVLAFARYKTALQIGRNDAKQCRFRKNTKGLVAKKPPAPPTKAGLLNLDFGAGVFKQFFERIRIRLGDAFFDGFRCAIYEILGFF